MKNDPAMSTTGAMETEWTDRALEHFSAVIAHPENAGAHLNLEI